MEQKEETELRREWKRFLLANQGKFSDKNFADFWINKIKEIVKTEKHQSFNEGHSLGWDRKTIK